jgi:hypothetical protein
MPAEAYALAKAYRLASERSRQRPGDTIAVSPHSIDPRLQGRSPKGDSARHFVRATTGLVRAVPVSCAPCPFRARRARFGILFFFPVDGCLDT